VLDQNGYAASANDGRSEMWTFRYGDAPTATSEEPALTLLVLNSDADDDAGDASADPTEPAEYEDNFEDICYNWGAQPPARMRIDIQGKGAFPRRMVLNNAYLVRRNIEHGTHTRPQWAIYGDDPGLDRKVMLVGDCWGSDFQLTRKRWLGTRPLADAEELGDWIPKAGSDGNSIGKLKFGARIFSWFEEEVGEKEALTQIHAFLEHHEFEVKPGVNFFGVMDADQSALWGLLSRLGFDADDEVELSGFIGLNSEYGAKFSFGTEQGLAAGLEAEAELLLLSSKVMKEFHNSPIASLDLGIEWGFGVAAEAETGQTENSGSIGIESAIKLFMTLTDKHEDEWTGEVAFGIEVERNEKGETEAELTLPSITLKSEIAWQPWPDVEFELGRPELELKFAKAIAGEDKGKGVSFEGTIQGAVVLFDEEIGTGAFSFERAGNTTTGKRAVENAEEKIKESKAALAKAETKKDSVAAAKAKESLAKGEEQLATAQKTLEYETAQQAQAKKHNTTYKPPVAKGEWDFKLTVGIGNLSLFNLIDLIHKARLAAQ
jgi:hypothetical protein